MVNPKSDKPSLHPGFIPASKQTSRVMTGVPSPAPHLGWHTRGYLPHWDHPGMIQSLNFRLNDAMPREVLERWKQELGIPSAPASLGAPASLPAKLTSKGQPLGRNAGTPAVELRRRIEEYLDASHGACWLRRPEIGSLVERALLHFDHQRYRLLAWCVMPNHIHALIETIEGWPLGEVLHSWKSFTANQANELLQRRGEFWQREYLDRYVRNAEHYAKVLAYIEDNPVKAGLAKIRTDWPLSSARFRAAAAASTVPGSAGIPAGD
jgi:REP element-mobilizing transposase RayT